MENSKYESVDLEFKDPLEPKKNMVNSEYVKDSELKDPLESKKEKKKKKDAKKKKNMTNSCVKDSETKDPSESKKNKKMAKSPYADVKNAEIKDTLESGHFIVVRLHCRNFARFCEANEFIKPNNENVLNLMNSCASSICKEMPDIILAYGFGKEYSFIFRKETDVYTRRASKLVSVIASLFTSSYRMNWTEFFPNKDIRSGASFEAEVLCLKTTRDVQTYLAFKQRECDETNLTNTCFWKLVESGKSEREAQEILEKSEKGKGRLEKNEILFQQFGINYNDLPDIFRHGFCILKTTEVFQCAASDVQAKKYDNGVYSRRKIIIVHTENVASPTFLNGYSILSEELTDLEENVSSIGEEQLNLWRAENHTKQDNWIVVRIDGCRFSRFTEVHKFKKPFDEPAAKLMNSCAMDVFEEFKDDILYGYGQSDEYSFVLEKNTQLFERRDSKLVSAICSLFTDAYVKRWKEFLPETELQYAPRFDGRAVCYKSYELIRRYLSFRQVDCHKNTQLNTLFWARVNNGESRKRAQKNLEGGDVLKERFQMLSQEFGIEYSQLPLMFRNGSSIFWEDDKEIDGVKRLVVEFPNIIEDGFWEEHTHILKDTDSKLTNLK